MDFDFGNSPVTHPAALSGRPRYLGTAAESEWFHILAQTVSATLLFILIFGMSATVDVTHLRKQVHNKFAILTGIATQFIVMPLLGYASVILLNGHGLTDPMAVSLLIVAASPGGAWSNWWCSMFNADLALSVTMTAISTMVSTIMLPANLLLYVNIAFGVRESGGDKGGTVLDKIDWSSLFVSLTIVIMATALGLLASFKISSHRFNRYANQIGSISGILLIVFSGVVTSLSGSKEAQIWGQPWPFYVGVTSPCLLGLCIATLLAMVARLRKPEVITVGVECECMVDQTATYAAVAMFDDPVERGQALCVPLFYGLMEAIVLGIYCIIGWKSGWTKAPKSEKICIIIATTYELEDGKNESELVGRQRDEERQEEHDPSGVDAERAVAPDAWPDATRPEHKTRIHWSMFRKRTHTTREETNIAAAPSSGRVPLSHEERQEEHDRSGVNAERAVAPDAWPDATRLEHKTRIHWSLFRKRTHTMREETNIAAAPSSGRLPLSQSINDGLAKSIAQTDAITDLV